MSTNSAGVALWQSPFSPSSKQRQHTQVPFQPVKSLTQLVCIDYHCLCADQWPIVRLHRYALPFSTVLVDCVPCTDRVRLCRYAHSIPLLESSESVGCLLSWCLRNVKWQQHGFQLTSKYASTAAVSARDSLLIATHSRFQGAGEPQYHQAFQLQGVNESEEEFEARFGWIQEIVVLVDICEGPGADSCLSMTVFEPLSSSY